MDELKGVLLRAMEFFLLQRDRNQLIQEKMLVSQRIVTMDRLRSIATFLSSDSQGCPQLASGLRDYAATANAADCSQIQLDSSKNTDLWNLTRQESVRLIEAMQRLQAPVAIRESSSTEPVDWRDVFNQCANRYSGVEARLNISTDVTTQGDRKLATAFADCLVRACLHFPESSLQLKDENGAAMVQVEIRWGESSDKGRDLFSLVNGDQDSSTDLLDAFLAIAAMGGETVGKSVDANALHLSFTIKSDSITAPSSGFDVELFERMFSTIEEA